MKNIIPKDTRYIPLTQQKSCCVPASISIIMYKHNIPLVPQELLGYHLGLVVALENKKLFWHPRTGKRPSAGYGTRINLKQYNPDSVFKKLGIPLKLVVHPIDKFKIKKEFIKFISNCIKKDKDILVCFLHKTGGHVCVVDRIYPSKNLIRLIDPSPNQPKWRLIKINILKKLMELHPTKSGGFWEIVKI